MSIKCEKCKISTLNVRKSGQFSIKTFCPEEFSLSDWSAFSYSAPLDLDPREETTFISYLNTTHKTIVIFIIHKTACVQFEINTVVTEVS